MTEFLIAATVPDKPVSLDERLRAIEADIRSFDLSCCQLYHEKVKRKSDGITPIIDTSVEHGFERVTFCSNKTRASRLGCAHTSARVRLKNLIRKLPESFCHQAQAEHWTKCVIRLEMAIIRADMKKSDYELEHARCSANLCTSTQPAASTTEQLADLNEKIRLIELEHNACIQQLSSLCDEILDVVVKRAP